MSILTLTRKALLAGTALVAVSFVVNAAHAADGSQPSVTTTYASATTGGNGANGTTGNPGTNGTAGDDGVEPLATNITLTNNSTITGGTGGSGGAGAAATNAGGLGAAGGYGVNLTSTYNGTSTSNKTTVVNTATHTIIGGNGGNGGAGGGGISTGGNAGDGSAGILAGSNYSTITNAGTIIGGTGGAGGNGSSTGTNGNGGAAGSGIRATATNVNITNTGSIIAGGAGAAGTGGSVAGTAGAAAHGINFAAGAINGVVNNQAGGSITGTSGSGVNVSAGATNAAITNAGTISVTTGTGVNVAETLGSAGLVNSGTISATSGSAVTVAASKSTTLFRNTGIISATTGTAVTANGLLGGFNNAGGTITSAGAATVVLAADQTASGNLTLNGTISNTVTANNTSAAVNVTANQTAANRIINTGTLVSDGTVANSGGGIGVSFNTFTGTFENQGTMRGQVTGGTGVQSFVNSAGTLVGNVNLGDGNNNFTVSGGTVTGSLTGGINDDTFTFSGGTTTGAIVTGDGTNIVNLNGGTQTGTITGGAGVDTLNFNGGVHTPANAIDLGAGANVVNYNVDRTLGSTMGATGGTLAVNIAAGKTVTVNSAISQLGGLSVGAGSVLNVNSSTANAASGALTNAGTINIAKGTTLNVYNYTTGTGKFTFGVGSSNGTTLQNGVLNVANGNVDLTGTTLSFVVDANMAGLQTATSNFVTSTGTVTLPAGAVTDNSLLYNFTTAVAGSNATVTATRVANGLQGLSTNPNNAALGAVLDANLGTTNPELAATQVRLANASSSTELNTLLETMLPVTDGSAMMASNTVTAQSLGLTSTRLASLRGASGASSGDDVAQNTMWAQPFASSVSQDRRNNVAGYDADTYGVTVGADTNKLAKHAIFGVALSYGNTSADSDGASRASSDIDSYQIQAYGDYDLGNSAFVQGAVGYGWNAIDQSRNNVGGSGLSANADYDSQQYIASAAIGQVYTLHNNKAVQMTPRFGARYTHLTTDSYTESGAGGLGLNVNTDDADALELGFGSELSYNMATSHGIVKPSVHAGYAYDLIGDDLQTSSAFTGGGASFNTSGNNPSQSTFNVGAGVNWYSNDKIDVSINYDAQIKSDYTAHAGYVKLVRKF